MPCIWCFQQPGTATKNAIWLIADDHGLPKIEQGSAPIHAAMPNLAIALDTLAVVLRVYHTILSKCFFQYTPGH